MKITRSGRVVAAVLLGTCLSVASLSGVATAQGGSDGGDKPVATLKVESPNVEVKKAGADAFKPAKDGQKLREGDTVRTDATGRAEVDYGGDAYTRLDVDTELTIASLTDDQGNRQVEGTVTTGRTWNRTVALTESESFEQSGGGATAAVTGTAFAVECESVEHCDFTAIVDITTLTGADGVVKLLQPLDQCDATSGVLCGDITQISPEDLPQWITENLLRDLVERGLDDGGLRGTLVIEDDGSVTFVPEAPPEVGVGGISVTNPDPPTTSTSTTTTTQPSTVPSPPTGVGALPGWKAATVSWTPGSDGGSPITGYTVTAVGGLFAAVANNSGDQCQATPPATSCTVTGLDNDTTYTFKVTATNKNGSSQPSDPSNEVTPPVVLPYGAQVQYTATDPGTGFEQPGFDDSGWETGSGPFGTGTPGVCPPEHFPPANPAFPVNGGLWVRVTFELPEGASNLQIVGTIDNIAKVFVNGQSVDEYDGGYCSVNDIEVTIDEFVQPGTNVVAIHATDTGSQSFLDFTIQYTDPGGELTEAASTQSSGSTTTSTSTTSTSTTTTTTAPPATTEDTTPTSAPAE